MDDKFFDFVCWIPQDCFSATIAGRMFHWYIIFSSCSDSDSLPWVISILCTSGTLRKWLQTHHQKNLQRLLGPQWSATWYIFLLSHCRFIWGAMPSLLCLLDSSGISLTVDVFTCKITRFLSLMWRPSRGWNLFMLYIWDTTHFQCCSLVCLCFLVIWMRCSWREKVFQPWNTKPSRG